MTTAFFSHDDCNKHNMGPEHPECPERIAAILSYLAETGLDQNLDWVRPEEITRDQLLTVHPEQYLHQLDLMQPTRGRVFTDPDTAMMPDTLRAARLSAGANVQAVDMVMSGQATNAFVCARPPGHHAERAKSMGFCFYNNVALAAMRALTFHQLERVAIIDFDVHQGNGTVDIVGGDERILMCSSFQHPHYPNRLHDVEAPNIVNTPLVAGASSDDFRREISSSWWQAVEAHRPDLILISAGFDAHREDPLAHINLDEGDFAWITQEITALAEQFSQGRIVSTLEGGYDLLALAHSTLAHLEALAA